MLMPEPWRRHDLLRVEPRAWSRVLRLRPQLATNPHVAQWATLRRPLIVRRYTKEDTVELIPVALSLPPAGGKLRIAVQVAPEEISERISPQTLRAIRQEAPFSWQAPVAALLRIADRSGVEPRVFGSLLWQWLTGLPYLSATSDLDLLWPVTDPECASQLVRCLASIEADNPLRFDGEIILPDGGGVRWRELHRGASEVLVKTLSEVQLRPVAALFQAGTFVA